MKSILILSFILSLGSYVYHFKVQKGTASYYALKFNGRKTYSGEVLHNDSLTAAHRFLPMGTLVKVTNIKNDSSIVVRINDRMGKSNHIIDLTQGGAKKLNFLGKGIASVTIEPYIEKVDVIEAPTLELLKDTLNFLEK